MKNVCEVFNMNNLVDSFDISFLFQTGYLQTSKGDYFIEPVKGHNTTKHPHLIYKRSALPPEMHIHGNHDKDPNHMTCGVGGRYPW